MARHQRMLVHAGVIATVAALILYMAQNCGGRPDSTVQAIATAQSLKTGFFLPQLDDERGFGAPARIADPGALAARLGLTLRPVAGTTYSVATTAAGENILVVKNREIHPGPVASLTADGKAFEWGAVLMSDDSTSSLTDLFIRYPVGGRPEKRVSADGNDSNLFFVRFPRTAAGVAQPMLINWVDHIQTAGGAVLYRVGNTVLQAGRDVPVLAYEAVGNQVWRMHGLYRDGDIADGTLFWTADRKTYYSLNPADGRLVGWVRQDKDSMDRQGPVDRNSVRIPDLVTRLASQKGGGRQGFLVAGIDGTRLDARAVTLMPVESQFQLLKVAGATGLGLTTAAAPAADSADFDAFFEPGGVAVAGLGLNGGPLPGIPVYQPGNSYSTGTRLQIEYPVGSGIYREGVTRAATYNTYTKGDWWWSGDHTTRHTEIALASVDNGGNKTWGGEIARYSSTDGGEPRRYYTHQNMEEVEQRVRAEQLAQNKAVIEREYRELTANANGAMAAAESAAAEVEPGRLLERAAQRAKDKTVDALMPVPTSGSYADAALGGLKRSITKEIAGSAITMTGNVATGDNLADGLSLKSSVANIGGGTVAGLTSKVASDTELGRSILQARLIGDQGEYLDHAIFAAQGKLLDKVAVDGTKAGIKAGFDAFGPDHVPAPTSSTVIDLANGAAKTANSVAWKAVESTVPGGKLLAPVGEFGSEVVIDQTTAIGQSANAIRLYNQAGAKADELINLRAEGGAERQNAVDTGSRLVGQDWDAVAGGAGFGGAPAGATSPGFQLEGH